MASASPWAVWEGFLACPTSRAPLRWTGEGFADPAGGRSYPLRDGILRMEPEETEAGFYDAHPFGPRRQEEGGEPEPRLDKELEALLEQEGARGPVLDVGCGTGRLAVPLARRGLRLLALDRSVVSLAFVRDACDAACVAGNALAIPARDASFPLVVCSGVIHHTPDPWRALAECCRVIAPGGLLYLRAYNRRSLYRWIHAGPGGLLRLLARLGPPGRLLSDGLGWLPYRAIRGLSRAPARSRAEIRARYENLMLKSGIAFLDRERLGRAVGIHGLVVQSLAAGGGIQRNLSVVARRSDPRAAVPPRGQAPTP
ncbi:MAG: class I SAM-dependent methyltransferase [Planctomycetaceae bacterium]